MWLGNAGLNKLAVIVGLALTPSAIVHAALALPFAPGDVAVYRMGDGTLPLTNTGVPVFVDEYTPAGVLRQSIAMPTTSSGSNHPLIGQGTSIADGYLTRSADGQYLLLAGYGRELGGAGSVSGVSAAVVNRVVGRVDFLGNVDTSTALADAYDGATIRSATSTDGNAIWVTGNGEGVRYTTLGATSSTVILPVSDAMRVIRVFAGQLYLSENNLTGLLGLPKIGRVGTGAPTTPGQSYDGLNGFPGDAFSNPYGYYFANLSDSVAGVDTLYVADEVAGLLKYSLVSGTWTLSGVIGGDSDNYRGLDARVAGGVVTLFAVRLTNTSTSGGGELVTLDDAGGYDAPFSSYTPIALASTAPNIAFRGVAIVPEPIPEPSALVLLIAGSSLLFRRVRCVRFCG